MGARLVRSQWMTSQLGLIGLFLLFLDTGIFVHGNTCTELKYREPEIEALEKMRTAWKDTPDFDSNLVGWSSNVSSVCEYIKLDANPTRSPSWQGVECSAFCWNQTIDPNCTIWSAHIIGISLSNASIVGVLPPEVRNVSTFYCFTLTGNPNLTGPLPEIFSWINILDVHDNGFSGTIPSMQYLLRKLNLGGNEFTGEYPFDQLYHLDYLQELDIGDNLLYGEIQYDAFVNKTELKSLDMSDNSFNETLLDLNPMHHLNCLNINDNSFTGIFPDLSPMHKLIRLDVSGNRFEGPLPDIRGPFPSLEYVSLARNIFNGTLNLQDVFNLTHSTSLTTVDLSGNQLSGKLPSWTASSLGSIQELYLDNNKLSGILDISQMFAVGLLQADASATKLKIMSLVNNSIDDVISEPHIIASVTAIFKLEGNPYCAKYDSNNDAKRCYCLQICFVSQGRRKIVIVAATTSMGAVLLILLIAVWGVLLRNRRYKRYLQLKFEKRFKELDVKPTIFTYSELRAATRGFHEDMKLGQGGYGAVYQGELPSGQVVAIKELFKTAKAHDEFLNEVVLITGMKHRNLVSLKGCCLREPQRFLVYEYVDNYDVDQVLLGSRKEEMRGSLASWPARHKICLGIAHGLHYLHAMAHPRVIHRDIKAGNVLLNRHLEAKIADFGLALLFPEEQSRIMTLSVAGTKGYLAPEYAADGELSDKVDVYSFGVLCLEIISGRRNIDVTAPKDQIYLYRWVWKLHEQDRLMDLVDPTLKISGEEVKDVQRFLIMCLQCISIAKEKRPSMARIVSILQGDMEIVRNACGGEWLNSRSSHIEPGTLWEDNRSTSSSNASSWHPHDGHSFGGGNLSMQMSMTRGRLP